MDLPESNNVETLPENESMPYGIKLVAWARTIRWIGWGFGESLIPLFIFTFSKTFAEAGLFSSTYEIVTLLTLPIIGIWADKFPAKRLIIIALILYPFVGISYFLSGFWGAAIFIVIARGLNGFLWGLENMGVSTYYRRMSRRNNIGTSFGYIDSWSHFGWIIAAILGMYFVSFVPIHYLLLGISPFAIIALFIVLRAPKDTPSDVMPKTHSSFIYSFGKELSEWRTWKSHLWLLSTLVLFSGIIEALMWFFIPIDAYINGAKPALVVLLSVIAVIPNLFGYTLGKIADKRNEYTLISGGLIGIALVMLGLSVFPQYGAKLVASLVIGFLLELFSIIQKKLVTTLGPSETYGQRGSAFESIATMGDLIAPLMLGILLDGLGFKYVAIVIALFSVVLGCSYFLIGRKNKV